ncbi:hypothetical protein [Paraburkholderia adhaesiva]|uniref:hypothetical protein n=1 Tax=Paraburkholderia adhaesiva TaxID=2883244 RepID=UPI001F33E240|nr:hypothetical protein [Paraburkholderia adhaesiva]
MEWPGENPRRHRPLFFLPKDIFFALPFDFGARNVKAPLENRRASCPRSLDNIPTGDFFPHAFSGASVAQSLRTAKTEKKNDGSPNEEFGIAPARARSVMASIVMAYA